MATDKKSFILYCDQIGLFDNLEDAEAGKLIKHIFKYVNDEDPETDNRIVKIAFEPIKQQLKRDLKTYEAIKVTKSESGQLGNLRRWNLDLYNQVINKEISLEDGINIAKSRKASHPIANIAVNGNVNDTVNGNVNEIKKISIDDRKLKFATTLESFKDTYPRTLLNDFYKYWSEPNKSKTKFRQELEKTWDLSRRLETWAKNDKSFTNTNSPISNSSTGIGKNSPELK